MSTLINVNHELREKLEASSLFIKMHEAMGRDYRENYEKSIEENSVFEILTVENLSLVGITFLAGWAIRSARIMGPPPIAQIIYL